MVLKKLISASLVILSLFVGFINPIADAATLEKQYIKLGDRTYTVISVGVEVGDKVTFVTTNKFKLSGLANINWFAQNFKAKTAINAGFFKRDTRLPLGILYKDGKLLTGPIYSRSALIGYKSGTFAIKNLSFKGVIQSDAIKVEVHNFNQPRLSKSQVIIYNEAWGSTVNSIFKGGRLLLVNKENKIIGESTERARIPVDGYIIYGPQDKLKDLKIGDIVDFSYSIQGEDLEKINFILGAGPKLVENGQEINNISKENFSCASICREARRSAIGIKDDKLYFIIIPQNISVSNLSKILKLAGFDEAMNLDGGSSTQLYHKGSTYVFGAPINNALVIF